MSTVGAVLGSLVIGASPAIAAEQSVIHAGEYCILKVNQPHASVHVSGTINVTATTTCPIPMTSIYIDTN